VARLASGLMGRGIGAGSPVTILVPNSPDLFVIAHALFAIGAIAMPLSITATRDEVLSAVGKGGAEALIVGPELLPLAAEVAEGTPGALPILVSGGGGDNSIASLERTAPG